ncbi:cyclodeaminase/cyclohydrolase family protein [bacterium]|nr:cyclodeaminase/cyclohydrolase family protein [bacterium]
MGLKDLSVEGFVQALSSKEPTPGGGSAAAATGAMGVGLLLMVSHFLEETPAMSAYMSELDSIKKQLVYLIDEDANSFNKYMDAVHLPKTNEEEKAYRSKKMQEALQYAASIPQMTIQACVKCIPILEILEKEVKKNMISDLGSAASMLESAIHCAFLNVLINTASLKDKEAASTMLQDTITLRNGAVKILQKIFHRVETLLANPGT